MGAYSPNILGNSFISCARHNPDGDVVVYGDRRVTWGRMTPRVLRIADALVKLGVKKDDKVAFMFHNCPEFLETNWGIQVAGAIPAPMNYRFIPKEVDYQGNHCDANVFIYDSIWAEAVEPVAGKLGQIKHFVCKGESGIDGAIGYEEFVASGEEQDPQVENDWDDVAVMIYTGGTTGFPKGVMLTYGAHLDMFAMFLANAVIRSLTMDIPKQKHRTMMEALPIPGGARLSPVFRTNFVKNLLRRPGTYDFLNKKFTGLFSDPDVARKNYPKSRKYMFPSMPFFHDASYVTVMMAAMGGTVIFVLPDSIKFEPDKILALAEREAVTNMSNVPTGWKKLVSHPGAKQYDLTSLQLINTGGGSCPAKLKKQMMELCPNALVLDGFGQTEMTPLTSFRIDGDPDNIADRSVGKAVVEARVVDEAGNEVAQGEPGEIMYRSNTIMKGYYKDEDKTAEVIKDGWFTSGDLGYIDEHGEIRTIDRKKECINTGGEKVYPLEVEEIICDHGKVDDACVIGVPDEEWGSTVRAVVVMKAGASVEPKEIIDHCRGEIAGYKIPRSVVFTDALPFSPVGKMLRQKVRDEYGQPE